jgi:predicted acyl esterase
MSRTRRLAGLVADVALGLPVRAIPYETRKDVAVPMPDGVTLLADHYRPAGADHSADRRCVARPPSARRAGAFGGPVRVFLQRAKRWLEFDEWPPAAVRDQVWHLGSGGRLGVEPDEVATAGRACDFEVFHRGSHIVLPALTG